MANPFKQFLPEDEIPKKEIEEQVMRSVHMKAHFAGILEFFFAIMGLSLREDLEEPLEKETGKQNKDKDKPDYFF